MRFLCTLVIAAFGSYLPLPQQEGYGVGIWVRIGTPFKSYFLTPDFGSSTSRFFMDGHLSLMPYLDPKAPSSTWVESQDATFYNDKMELVKSVFDSIPFELSGRHLRGIDTRHVRGSHGRLGLGPDSIIAQSKVMALRRVRLNYGRPNGVVVSSAFGLFDTVPEVPENAERVVLPIVARSDGWFVNATLRLKANQKGSLKPVDIAIDVNVNPILVPKEDLDRLVYLVRYNQPRGQDAFVNPTGNLMVPCDSEGRFFVDLAASLSLVSGGELELDMPTHGISGGLNPDTKQPVCISPFEVNVYDGTIVVNPDGSKTISGGEWRLNPLYIKNTRTLFMDARGSRLVIDRTPPIKDLPVISSGPILKSMSLRKPHLEVSAEGAFLVFPRASVDDVKQYSAGSRFPWQGRDGSWTLSVPCIKGTGTEGTGRFDVESFPDHQFEIPDEFIVKKHSEDSLRLPLIRVDPSQPMTRSSRPRYSLTINTGELLLFISLRPVTENSNTRVHADRVGAVIKEVAGDFKHLGLN